jgi:hypothetical protein
LLFFESHSQYRILVQYRNEETCGGISKLIEANTSSIFF